jgi:hypothetical protein
MAKVEATEKLERMTAAYLTKLGRATPDQQRLAYEWFCERIETVREANKRPVSRQSEDERNLIIAACLEYCQQNNIEMSQKQACREIAADLGANEETVIASFSKWKNGKTDQEKERQSQRLNTRLLDTVGELIKARNEKN